MSVGASAAHGAAAGAALRRRRHIPLPSPQQVRDQFTRMVEFGPRLTASPQHERYISWLEGEFDKAGLALPYCDGYTTDRWLVERFGLDVLHGPGAGPVKVATYYPRSRQTPEHGITGPLVYGGTAPTLSISGTDLAALKDAVGRYPAALESWARGLSGTLQGGTHGSILVVDLPMPVPLTGLPSCPRPLI